MRKVLMVAAIAACASAAHAADMPEFPLRGSFPEGLSKSAVRWEGAYVGGQASYGANDMDFTNSGQDLLAKLLNNVDVEGQYNLSKWPLQGKSSQRNSGFGGFVGYNSQWEDVIFGVEMNYIHGKFDGSSSGSQSRTFFFPADYYTTATVSSSSAMQIKDYGSLRLRGGYTMGNFLPYAFAGLALGQADITRNANYRLFYQYVGTATPALPNLGPYTDSLSENAKSHFIYGYAAGLGVDVMLMANLFMRAEYEFLRFTAPIDTTISSVRVGLGYKF
jgi:outer membrane immunogenic protein